MAYRSAPIADDIIWRAAPQPEDASLADAVRETIASTRKHLLDFIRLDETPPPTAMTLAQWTRPATFRSLLAAYSDHIYRHTPAYHVKISRYSPCGRNGISG